MKFVSMVLVCAAFCSSISFSLFIFPGIARPENNLPAKIGFHQAVYDENGKLLPWEPWSRALVREMDWYLNCPVGEHGYPVFIYTTFMDENYQPYRTDTIFPGRP